MSTVTGAGVQRESLLTRPFLIVTATALVFFVYIGILIPIVPLFIEGPLHAGEFGIGLTVAVFALAAICARPLLGRLADRYGRRVLMVGGATLAGLSGIASSQITEFWQLLVLRGFTGVGEAAVFVGAATLIADMSPRDRRGEGASYFSVAVFGGIGMGPIIGEALLDDTNFERAFFVAGLFAFLAAFVALFAPARVEPHEVVDDTIASAAPVSGR
ncbi:MAG: MFS transporter, partial [Acidimicrobiales bacterium]